MIWAVVSLAVITASSIGAAFFMGRRLEKEKAAARELRAMNHAQGNVIVALEHESKTEDHIKEKLHRAANARNADDLNRLYREIIGHPDPTD